MIRLLALTIVCLNLVATQAFAWGNQGHVIVARIAQDLLSEETKAELQDIIGDRKIWQDDMPVWLDKVRRKEPWETKYPGNDKFHFININNYTHKLPNSRYSVLTAIPKFLEIAADESISRQERKEALSIVVHCVGDLHQPLHCASDSGNGRYFTRFDGEFAHARGRYQGENETSLNLHSIWDNHLVKEAMAGKRSDVFAKELAQKAQEHDEWKSGTLKDWAYESHNLAVSNALVWIEDGEKVDLPYGDVLDLDSGNYAIEENVLVIRQRLMQGGVRLAWLLDEAFKD
jgi:hypothetical protein